jgi:hypothetical protein
MEMALKTLPTNPRSAYKGAVDRIKANGGHTSVTARRILTWVFYAARPLHFDELSCVLRFEEKQYYEAEDGHIEVESNLSAADIAKMCQSLIVCEESGGVVRFIHSTVQECIDLSDLIPPVNIANICINYLMNYAFENPCLDWETMLSRGENHRFLSYASRFWGFHVRGEAESTQSTYAAVFKPLGSEERRKSILQMAECGNGDVVKVGRFIHPSFDHLCGVTILHILARDGLSIILSKSFKCDTRQIVNPCY